MSPRRISRSIFNCIRKVDRVVFYHKNILPLALRDFSTILDGFLSTVFLARIAHGLYTEKLELGLDFALEIHIDLQVSYNKNQLARKQILNLLE